MQFLTNQTLIDIVKYFEKNPDQKQRLVSTNNDYLNIAIRPFDDSSGYTDIVAQVKSLAYQYLGDYEIHFAGQPYLAGETPNLIKKDVSYLMAIGIVIMFIILFLNFRSVYSVIIILITIISSFLAMLGFMGWMRYITGSNYFDFTIGSETYKKNWSNCLQKGSITLNSLNIIGDIYIFYFKFKNKIKSLNQIIFFKKIYNRIK